MKAPLSVMEVEGPQIQALPVVKVILTVPSELQVSTMKEMRKTKTMGMIKR